MSKPKDPIRRATTETVAVNADWLKRLKSPPFQRPLRVNAKVLALAQSLKDRNDLDGCLPGVLTLGRLAGDFYLLDGQHRVEAFKLSELRECYADVRIMDFESMGDMGEEYVTLNSQMVRMRPDDILRGLEGSNAGLALLRRRCGFVGYDMIRRSERAPLISASLVLRAWHGSAREVPASSGMSAVAMAQELTVDEAGALCDFLTICHAAWGSDPEYQRLYGTLNLTLCAWLFRRTVITQFSPSSARLTREQFRSGLGALSADSGYLDYLVGRLMTERDRSPAYGRIKGLFTRRLQGSGKAMKLPAPSWSAWSRDAVARGRVKAA